MRIFWIRNISYYCTDQFFPIHFFREVQVKKKWLEIEIEKWKWNKNDWKSRSESVKKKLRDREVKFLENFCIYETVGSSRQYRSTTEQREASQDHSQRSFLHVSQKDIFTFLHFIQYFHCNFYNCKFMLNGGRGELISIIDTFNTQKMSKSQLRTNYPSELNFEILCKM